LAVPVAVEVASMAVPVALVLVLALYEVEEV
jgi:hypothetical protein